MRNKKIKITHHMCVCMCVVGISLSLLCSYFLLFFFLVILFSYLLCSRFYSKFKQFAQSHAYSQLLTMTSHTIYTSTANVTSFAKRVLYMHSFKHTLFIVICQLPQWTATGIQGSVYFAFTFTYFSFWQFFFLFYYAQDFAQS